MNTLNWKEIVSGERWVAHASRRVGGKYRIDRNENYCSGIGYTGVVSFDVRRLINAGGGGWNNPCVGWAKTLDDAKRIAETHHASRAALAHAQVEPAPLSGAARGAVTGSTATLPSIAPELIRRIPGEKTC